MIDMSRIVKCNVNFCVKFLDIFKNSFDCTKLIFITYFYSTTKHEIIQIKITIYYVVWTCLNRVGCFYWLVHCKRMRIVNCKYIGVHCTLYSVHFKHNNDKKSGKGKGEVRKYKKMVGYSVEGLEQRETYL